MSHIAWFLVILGIVILGVLVVAFLLVRTLASMAHQSSQVLLEQQSQTTEALQDLSAASQQLLLMTINKTMKTHQRILQNSSSLHLSTLVGISNQMMSHQELLINRLLAKDPYSVQVLDARRIAEDSSTPSEYVPMDDESEAERYADLAKKHTPRDGDTIYEEFLKQHEIDDDVEVSGLPIN